MLFVVANYIMGQESTFQWPLFSRKRMCIHILTDKSRQKNVCTFNTQDNETYKPLYKIHISTSQIRNLRFYNKLSMVQLYSFTSG